MTQYKMAHIRYRISWEKFGDFPEFERYHCWMKQTLSFSVSNARIGREFMKKHLPTGKVRNFTSSVIYAYHKGFKA